MKFVAKALFIIFIITHKAAAQTPDDRTQIVAQWLLSASGAAKTGTFSSDGECFSAEDKIAAAASNIFFDDGDDIGSGTCNIYLYTTHVDATVNILISLEKNSSLPSGLRIGVARYTNKAKTDWTYIPAFPPGLTHFDIMYDYPK